MSLADLICQSGRRYIDDHRSRIPVQQERTLQQIAACRTSLMGGHVAKCDCCGEIVYSYHSCKNRHCPQCGQKDSVRWVDHLQTRMLPTHYFHVVFTVPHELNELFHHNQAEAYHELFAASFDALSKVMGKQIGSDLIFGAMSVLHTWTRTLHYHPHIHMLVPGGGYDRNTAAWISSDKHYLGPDRALSSIFRAVLAKRLRRIFGKACIDKKAWNKDWVVKTFPTLSHTDKIVSYLGRYVTRTAITNSRIVNVSDTNITYTYKSRKTAEKKFITLSHDQFLQKFLQHVLPKGFTRVRYYGLLAPGNRTALEHVILQLTNKPGEPIRNDKKETGTASLTPLAMPCPECKKGKLVVIMIVQRGFTRGSRSPP